MTICYLSLGSNLSNPSRQINCALESIKNLPRTRILQVASIYRSKSWGRKQLPNYLNTVVAIKTNLSAQQLLRYCQAIENKQGRKRGLRWGSRTIDIDLLVFGQLISCHKKLQLPHPRMLKRDFMILPLLEIAPTLCLPTGEAIAEAFFSNQNLIKTIY